MVVQYDKFRIILMIFGRTDLEKGVSGAKFCEEFDGDVRLTVAPQKPGQNEGNLIFRSEKFAENLFLTPKNEMSGIV